MDTDLAIIYMFAGNFAPRGFATCDGQILAISTNTAVFSLVGTSYGGNGTSNFALPDLRGRTAVHLGQGVGLSPYVLGQSGGAETVTLNQSQMPAHSHALKVNDVAGTTATPGTTTYLAAGPSTGSGPNATALKSYTTTASNTTLAPTAIASVGGGQPFSVLQPYLTLTFIFALEGIFPSRN